eukprot:COSAG05_NODE_537_length_8855_cov_23.915829_8_plen_110_part_00
MPAVCVRLRYFLAQVRGQDLRADGRKRGAEGRGQRRRPAAGGVLRQEALGTTLTRPHLVRSTWCPKLSLSLSLSLSHAHTLSLSRTHTHTHTLSLSLSLSRFLRFFDTR